MQPSTGKLIELRNRLHAAFERLFLFICIFSHSPSSSTFSFFFFFFFFLLLLLLSPCLHLLQSDAPSQRPHLFSRTTWRINTPPPLERIYLNYSFPLALCFPLAEFLLVHHSSREFLRFIMNCFKYVVHATVEGAKLIINRFDCNFSHLFLVILPGYFLYTNL